MLLFRCISYFVMYCVVFFLFKQKTAYEMRISDWSSDVCSSDLLDGCIAVDANCNPLSPCLTWMDRRATAEIEDIPADLVRATCGLVLDPGHLGAKAR